MNNSLDIIKTDRLSLVPFSREHLGSRYLGWLNDKTTMHFSEQRHKKHSLKSSLDYWRSFQNTPNHLWAIETSIDNLGHIGNVNAYLNIPNQIADIGIMIGERGARGRGFGLEAFGGVVDFLFKKEKMRKITAGTVISNKPMIHIMKKMGMNPDGIRKKHYIIEGVAVDVIHMALFADEYENPESA